MDTVVLVERFRGHRDSVYSVAFTPDGKGLVSGSLDKSLKFWDVGGLDVPNRMGLEVVLVRRVLGPRDKARS